MAVELSIVTVMFLITIRNCSQILATVYFDTDNKPLDGFYNFDGLLSSQYNATDSMSYTFVHQFGFHYGNNGYVGIESLSNKTITTFQIWGAINCSASIERNAKCISGNSEGSYWNIQMSFNYTSSILYRFHVSYYSNNWWRLTIFNENNKSDNGIFVGEIQVPSSWKNIGITNAYLWRTDTGQDCNTLPQNALFILGEQFNNNTYILSNITVIIGDPEYNVTCPCISDKQLNTTDTSLIIQKDNDGKCI
eukprot:18047_1